MSPCNESKECEDNVGTSLQDTETSIEQPDTRSMFNMDTSGNVGTTTYETANEGSSKKHKISTNDEENQKQNDQGKEPKIGMEFETDEASFEFYHKYGESMGFGIRKEWSNKNKKGIVIRRKYVCSKAGSKRPDKRRTNVKYPREETRNGCTAHMVISLKSNGKYVVEQLGKVHNHQCIPTRLRRRIPTIRALKENLADSVGITQKATYDLLHLQAEGCGNMSYLSSKRMQSMEMRDIGATLQYLQKMVATDIGSFYAIQVDEEQKIANIFWADSKMVVDYTAFGDVVCFDTTFKTNNYDRPFAPFVGVNNHKQTVIFGAALIYDETTDSFLWVFKAFLEAMSNKKPQTILTDQNAAIAKAITLAMPNTFHRICVWHVYQNVAKSLSNIFGGLPSFRENFEKCFFDYEDEADFLEAWERMFDKYKLRSNEWLQNLFEKREKWALVYGRQSFCADMISTQRSENLNGILRRYLSRKFDLLIFFENFERVVADRRNAEVVANFKMTQSTPHLALNVPLLEHARDVYTPVIFTLFQLEYALGMSCVYVIVDQTGNVSTYKITPRGRNREYFVWVDTTKTTVACSCKKFEFSGILCGHALRILDSVCVQEIPDRYILKRWRKNAKETIASVTGHVITTTDEKVNFTRRYKDLMHSCMKLSNMAAENEDMYAMAITLINEGCTRVANCLNQSSRMAPTGISTNTRGFDMDGSQHGDNI